MNQTLILSTLLFTSLTLLLAQLQVKQKQALHLLFAVFCGSMAMFAARQLSNGSLGQLDYLLAMASSMTCNGYWLVSRALFRGPGGVTLRHVIAAGSLAGLLIIAHGLDWLVSLGWLASQHNASLQVALGEVVNMMSSTMLVLTAWEGMRGLAAMGSTERRQRFIFLASFIGAVLSCTVILGLVATAETRQSLHGSFAGLSTLQIMLVTQFIIIWQKRSQAGTKSAPLETPASLSPSNGQDKQLAQQITQLLVDERGYLQPGLKVADLARQLDLPEYRISRVMREHLQASNFNQFVNELRIRHARRLLADPQNRHWSVLVIGLESGFASVGPFTRAFKSACGVTPNQYRNQHLASQPASKQAAQPG